LIQTATVVLIAFVRNVIQVIIYRTVGVSLVPGFVSNVPTQMIAQNADQITHTLMQTKNANVLMDINLTALD
jgi:hypothetical protein